MGLSKIPGEAPGQETADRFFHLLTDLFREVGKFRETAQKLDAFLLVVLGSLGRPAASSGSGRVRPAGSSGSTGGFRRPKLKAGKPIYPCSSGIFSRRRPSPAAPLFFSSE